jgi:hypothetical protein
VELMDGIRAMGGSDWFRLGEIVFVIALSFVLGFEAGYAKAARNVGVGWLGVTILVYMVVTYTIAAHGNIILQYGE